MKGSFYSITDCANVLGVQEHRIHYAHRARKLPEPRLRIAGKRIYSEVELRQMAEYFHVKKGEQDEER